MTPGQVYIMQIHVFVKLRLSLRAYRGLQRPDLNPFNIQRFSLIQVYTVVPHLLDKTVTRSYYLTLSLGYSTREMFSAKFLSRTA